MSKWDSIKESIQQNWQKLKTSFNQAWANLRQNDLAKRVGNRLQPLLSRAWWQARISRGWQWGQTQWQALRSFSWKRADIALVLTKTWQRIRRFFSQEELNKTAQQVKEKAQQLSEQAKPLADQAKAKARELSEQAKPLAEQAKARAEALSSQAREQAATLSEKTKDLSAQAQDTLSQKLEASEEWLEANQSEGPSRLEAGLTWAARWPWLQRQLGRYVNLPFFRAKTTFYRYLVPTIGLLSLLLVISGLFLYGYVRSNLNQTKEDLRVEATESLREDIFQKYGTYVEQMSKQLEQDILDNVTTADIVADAPTFQDLNIQRMEEFSRSLLRKDTNLLNVVVLTHEAVKRNIRTRRIGDTTRFLFTCCELPSGRQVSFQEIDEKEWMDYMDERKSSLSNIYVNPVNGEKYFYHASTIEDIKASQLGTVLLRYNLNFAIRTIQSALTGNNFLVANDSLIVATSQDTVYPNIQVAAYVDTSNGGPIDYIYAVIDQIRQATTPQEAVQRLRQGRFIRNPYLFEQQFSQILPGKLPSEPIEAEGGPYWLTEAQALAIMDLSFGQLLGLKRNQIGPTGTSFLSANEASILAMAYLDSMREVRNGVIVDDQYLISFATNQFGWIMINQSSTEQYLAPVIAKNDFIIERFGKVNRRVFWFVFLIGILSLLLLLVLTSGMLHQITAPINQLADRVEAMQATRFDEPPEHLVSKDEAESELAYLGDSFEAMHSEIISYIGKLEASNHDLEQYAQLVAHDLREPLRAINSYLELLQLKHEEEFDEDSMTYLGFARSGAKRMDLMIRQLLSYSKLSQKLTEASWMVVDLNDHVKHALENLQPKVEGQSYAINVLELPQINCKAAMLTVVFQNLIDNAIKYRQQDQPLTIEIGAEEHEAEWHVYVQDNGIGIPKAQQNRIFKMFSRLSPYEHDEGVGIGLASCQKIVRYNGGRLWVASEGQNKGSRFTFSLPKPPMPERMSDDEKDDVVSSSASAS